MCAPPRDACREASDSRSRSRALLRDARLVILDEPTAALGVAETAEVLALIHRLRECGLGVIVISHSFAWTSAERLAAYSAERDPRSKPRTP